ncbi:hypothetical protein BGX31_001970 [Mortierella sp. GBA43]|nr:hypothetical protein BGX31_001970 [Mortierella sp. GBA43]
MGGHIQSFVTSVNLNTIPTQHFVKDMVGCWSQTLESLTIYHAHLIASQDIQLILTSCPKLKKFNCFCYWLIHRMRYGTIRDLGLKATMIAEIGANDASRVDWVCTELEELKMTFADGRRDPEEGQSFPDQEQLVVQGMKEIYQQLGRLTKLKELLMGWYSPDRFSKDPNMDLSLESGLGYMSELKSLRKLDLAYFRRVNFGLEEAEWIRKNWPALETINGLKYRRIPGEDVDVPDYSSLLPWLCIS